MNSPSKKDKNKTIFIVAGEESGDIHGSHIVRELLKITPGLKFIGHGGDKMKAAGVEIVEHISKLSLVGFTEVLKHLPYMRKVMNNTIESIRKTKPDRVILIDYPGFNLRLAEKVHALQIPITYFILPQVWAWKEKRLQNLKKYTDQAISIIPFEKDWYRNRGMDIDYIGHPFVDIEKPEISKKEFFNSHSLDIKKPLLTLLPGSRQQEIDRHWPIIIDVIEQLHTTFSDLQFIIGKAPNVNIANIPQYVKIENNSHLALMHGTAGIVASGTATLEAAIFNLPVVVCYKTSALTHWIGKRLAKVEYLSLTNLILNRKVVPELLQNDMSAKAITKALIPLLSDTPEMEKMILNYSELTSKLGKPGVYKRIAEIVSSKL